MNSFTELSTDILQKVYFGALYEVAFAKKRSWFTNRIRRSNDGVKGFKVNMTFLTDYGWSWRPMSEFGYTPTGSKLDSEEQYAELCCHAAAAQVTQKAILATEGDVSRMGSILDRSMKGLMETFPYYIRNQLWTPQTGILGQAVSKSGLVITLDNVGLWNTNVLDRAKLFEPGMYVQVLDSNGDKRGNPIRIDAVNKTLGTITVSSDPGIADNDTFAMSDIAGLDDVYNTSMTGIFDVIDDDNTFQGVDRSAAAGAKFRAIVEHNSGTPRAMTHDLFANFFHKCFDPDFAFTRWEIVNEYWKDNLRSGVNFTPGGDFVDGFQYVQIGKTKLVEDEDADVDKVIVPDFKNMFLAERGQVESLFGQGWRQIPGRPFMEYPVVWWGQLIAEDCRYMGVLKDIGYTL
jgi:hypothetical protein